MNRLPVTLAAAALAAVLLGAALPASAAVAPDAALSTQPWSSWPADTTELGVAAAPPAPTRAPADTVELRVTLERIASAYDGVAGISLRNLETGESISIRGDEKFPSASLIKVAILVTLLDEVHAGRMVLDEPVSMVARDRVGGSGVLKHMASGTALTLEDLAWLMTVISDNTATNLLLDKLDIRTVGLKMESLGLPETKVHSKSFRRATSIAPDSSALYGLGVTSPDETVSLFAMLHEGRAVSPELDSLAIRMLLANQDGTMLTRWLPSGIRVAHKSGTVSEARNDCGIIYAPAAPVALCVMTRENEDTSYAVDATPHLLVAEVAREVYRVWSRGPE